MLTAPVVGKVRISVSNGRMTSFFAAEFGQEISSPFDRPLEEPFGDLCKKDALGRAAQNLGLILAGQVVDVGSSAARILANPATKMLNALSVGTTPILCAVNL